MKKLRNALIHLKISSPPIEVWSAGTNSIENDITNWKITDLLPVVYIVLK
jgi:hypothetical protein